MKLYLVGLLGLSLTACVPSIPIPMPTPVAKAKPPSEVMQAAALTPREGAGVIVVRRDKTILWRKRCIYDIAVDGQRLAGLRNGQQVTLYADPGPRLLEVSIRPDDDCKPAVAQVPVRVVASATTTIRIAADVSYDLRVESTSY